MKKLTLFTALVFSLLMFSSTSLADWTKVSKNVEGNTYYVDFERIRKHGGYVYWCVLDDYLRPQLGDLSAKVYHQGDCILFRYKYLSFSHHKEPMGGGTGEIFNPKNPEWYYPPPDSSGETILKAVCEYAN